MAVWCSARGWKMNVGGELVSFPPFFFLQTHPAVEVGCLEGLMNVL